MKTIVRESLDKLNAHAIERIDCSKPVNVPKMKSGQMFAQGDIGILRLEKLPKGAKKIDPPQGGQIAPGSTIGSRHCVDVNSSVAFYKFSGDDLSDIAIVAKDSWALRHPTHADCTFEPGIFQFVQQQNEQQQRVRD